jgi:chitinase
MFAGTGTASAHDAPDPDPPYRIVGYVTGGADIWDVDAEKLTHVNYAFAQVSEADTIYFRNEKAPQHLAQLQALKAHNPDLKLLVSVGGWGAKNFTDAALTDSSRTRFARSAVRMVKQYGLDGVDIDWEFPGQAVGGIEARPEDKRNFTLLLKTLRTHLDSLSAERGRVGDDRYLLTIASNDNEAYFEHTEMETAHRPR